jgi:endoglucanase
MEQRKIINNRIDPANMPLSTKGKLIVDKNGDEVRLACVNWYGAHMERYVVNGLDLLPMDEIANDIANDGFNCVRLPFSLEQFFVDPVVSADAVMANPDLKGKTSMEIFDATIKSLAKAGLMVILNNHNSDAMWCCSLTDGNGYWHTDKYPTHKWEEALLSLTRRY